ncbi:MAG: sterol desaturase family protein [Marinovum sp.]|jgi:Delta7-sterol 5-desaturase|nr:sterol desaturase family protein [Marinovum sp.]MBT6533018.1 sterol desaturase family protein [Marinovum sp.]
MSDNSKKPRKNTWSYSPALPIHNSPIFDWPPRPVAALKWISNRWLNITASSLFLIIAILVYNLGQPVPETLSILVPGWIFQIWMRNLILLGIFAGGIHLWLFTFSMQGERFKFDTRSMIKNNGTFTFRDQVHDNMFWSLTSGVAAWTFFEVLYLWAAASGAITVLTFKGSEIWFFAWLIMLPIMGSMHFYWIHRLLHWPPLYRSVHELHHRSINIGPWSGLSMHPVESGIYMSSILVFFIIPAHPVIVLLHLYIRAIGPCFTHAGFETILAKNKKVVDAGDFHHQLHHRYFECNYGTAEMPWDRWFGSFHDGTPEATERIRTRKKLLLARK